MDYRGIYPIFKIELHVRAPKTQIDAFTGHVESREQASSNKNKAVYLKILVSYYWIQLDLSWLTGNDRNQNFFW